MAKKEGKKDACYHKVKSRYSVWPSAYASGALVKCRKVGAKNWGNKSESFEMQEGNPMYDPEKAKKATSLPAINPKQDPRKNKKNQSIGRSADAGEPNAASILKKRTGGASLPNIKKEELNIDLAVDYFFSEGINEDGLEMIIEEIGLEKFVEFVEYLTDIEVLTEARSAKRARKGAKSYEQVKAEIDAKEKAKKAKREISVDKTKKATETAKAKQPVEKKPVRDAIARGVFRAVDAYKKGMERHNAAMATAKKAGKVAGAITKEIPSGVKTAGKAVQFAHAVATRKEEVEITEGDKYDDVGKQAARMSLLNNPGPRSTPKQTAEKKARLEKKRGMKLDDHPQFKKEEVEEGYRVVSTSFKSGDGNPQDDITIKKQKKVVSGDNLTKKGAEKSANARRQEYGTGDTFQVQKTRTAKKRPSNAASEAEVKAKIDAKEKKQQKSRAQQSIAGMNRAGTPSGKVAAARLKTDKKFNKEEVDKRRAPAELVARLSAKREGHMAQDGPNKAAYDAKQRILKKTKDKMTEEIVRSILDEAGKKCWKGYKKTGTQKLFGKTYNRCVKANEETEVTEGRAEDAQTSLAKVKDRQKVLDAHEKKTGKKLDITKTPEYKSHKQNFPGAKRTEKKVKGTKETSAEKHNRQVQTYTDRLKKYGKTTKQQRDDAAMAKHTSRFD
jgi:hypothetical protein